MDSAVKLLNKDAAKHYNGVLEHHLLLDYTNS